MTGKLEDCFVISSVASLSHCSCVAEMSLGEESNAAPWKNFPFISAVMKTAGWPFIAWPTPGRCLVMGIPWRESSSRGPMPESMRILGVLNEPGQRITSCFTSTGFPM
jgi:hypothetical protein